MLLGTPSASEGAFFWGAFGPLSLWYLIRQNAVLLQSIWSNNWAKLACGLIASVTVTGSKVFADQQIRILVQSSPSLFPSAQQTITIYNVFSFTLMEISVLIGMIMMFRLLKFTFKYYDWNTCPLSSIGRHLVDVEACFWGFGFLLVIIFLLDTGSSGMIVLPKYFSLTEELFIHSTFIPNQVGRQKARLCTNLDPDLLISPADSSDMMPQLMISARPLKTGPDELGRTYEYRIVRCTNPANSPTAPDTASH